MLKKTLAVQETQVRPLGWEDPLEKEMATCSSVLAWKESHEQRSLVGYSPRVSKELDTSWRLNISINIKVSQGVILSSTGFSFLEN